MAPPAPAEVLGTDITSGASTRFCTLPLFSLSSVLLSVCLQFAVDIPVNFITQQL
jgi:hypothetical protein